MLLGEMQKQQRINAAQDAKIRRLEHSLVQMQAALTTLQAGDPALARR
jgi:hypothetical protein